MNTVCERGDVSTTLTSRPESAVLCGRFVASRRWATNDDRDDGCSRCWYPEFGLQFGGIGGGDRRTNDTGAQPHGVGGKHQILRSQRAVCGNRQKMGSRGVGTNNNARTGVVEDVKSGLARGSNT